MQLDKETIHFYPNDKYTLLSHWLFYWSESSNLVIILIIYTTF